MRALRLLVELAVGPERQRMGGDHRALAQQGEDRRRQVAPMESLVWGHVAILVPLPIGCHRIAAPHTSDPPLDPKTGQAQTMR